MAYHQLIDVHKLPEQKQPAPEKVLVQAVDAAAGLLGNTRSVARSSYVHPHLLQTYGTKEFNRYYAAATRARSIAGLGPQEKELLIFLEQLFEHEFDLLQKQ